MLLEHLFAIKQQALGNVVGSDVSRRIPLQGTSDTQLSHRDQVVQVRLECRFDAI